MLDVWFFTQKIKSLAKLTLAVSLQQTVPLATGAITALLYPYPDRWGFQTIFACGFLLGLPITKLWCGSKVRLVLRLRCYREFQRVGTFTPEQVEQMISEAKRQYLDTEGLPNVRV